MISTPNPLSFVGFLNQNYRDKFASTQIPYEADLAINVYTDQKFLPTGIEPVRHTVVRVQGMFL